MISVRRLIRERIHGIEQGIEDASTFSNYSDSDWKMFKNMLMDEYSSLNNDLYKAIEDAFISGFINGKENPDRDPDSVAEEYIMEVFYKKVDNIKK